MKRRILLVGSIFLMSSFTQAQNYVIPLSPNQEATSDEKQNSTSHLDLKQYINFVLEWTSYKYNNEPLPQVKVISHELIQIFAHGDFKYAQAEAKGIKLPSANATYDLKHKTIYLSEKLDLNSSETEITIVHELVHYLQDINGYTQSLGGHIECTESEAYDVQMLWQTINKVNEESIPYVYQESLKAAMECMGDQTRAFPKYTPQE